MEKYTAIIGLEIHVELKTQSKMFCGCPNDPHLADPNTNICEVCLAHPGTLPVPNAKAIEWAVKIARALNCSIQERSQFDRKHYFYPDLPKGYQISQDHFPIGYNGFMLLEHLDKNHRLNAKINVARVHLEEDTAKLSHSSGNETVIDFNRAGVPLVEMVSCPDLQSALEAKTYCQELQLILRYLGVSDADMEKGQMRCEANVSVQSTGQFHIEGDKVVPAIGYTLNNKVEVKNINSFRAVEKAIEFEIKRQTGLLEDGKIWPQETRGWDDPSSSTVSQRIKENSADYRYFPEPDIPPFEPLVLTQNVTLPELPMAKRNRFHNEYGFSYADADLLTANQTWAEYAEEVMGELAEWLHTIENESTAEETRMQKSRELAKLAGGWLTSKLIGILTEKKMDIKDVRLSPENFAELVALIYTQKVNSTNAQKILLEMVESGVDMDPTHIMEDKGYGQIKDENKLAEVINQTIANYPAQVAQFKAGKEPIIKFLLGMVMKSTEGSADPQVAEKMLREKMLV